VFDFAVKGINSLDSFEMVSININLVKHWNLEELFVKMKWNILKNWK